MSDLSTDVKNAALSNWVKGAYKKECVTWIAIHGRPDSFNRNKWLWTAHVKFEHGNTKGEQRISNSDMSAMMYELKMFLDALK